MITDSFIVVPSIYVIILSFCIIGIGYVLLYSLYQRVIHPMYETFISTIEQQEIQAIETVVQQQKTQFYEANKGQTIPYNVAKRKLRLFKKMKKSIETAKKRNNVDSLRQKFTEFKKVFELSMTSTETEELETIETVVQQQKIITLREVKERRIDRRTAELKMNVLKKMEYSIRNAKTTLNLDQLRKDYVQFQKVFNISTENAIGTSDVHLDTSTPDDPENNPSELNDAFDENEEDNDAAEAEIQAQEDAIEEMPPMTSDTTETEEDAAVELDEDQLPENQDVGKSTKEGEPPRDLTNIYRYDP